MALFADALMVNRGYEELLGGAGGRDDPFAVRAGEEVGALGGDVFAPGGGGADVFATEEAGGGDDIGAGFEGDEAGDVAGVVEAAGPDGDVEILALPVEGGAGEGHPVFPAVEAADVAGAEGVGAEAVAVAGGPDEALFVCRHQLAVDGGDFALRVDVDERAVEAVAGAVCGALDAAEVDGDMEFGGGRAEGIEMAGFDLDGLGGVFGEDGFLEGGVEAGTVGEVGPEGVAGDEGFAEGDELAALVGGLADEGVYLGEGGVALELDGGDLGEAEGEEVRVGGGHGGFCWLV